MSRKNHNPIKSFSELAAAPKQETQVRILLNQPEKGTSGLKEWAGFISEAYNQQLFWPGVSDIYSRLRTSCPEIVMIARAFTSWARNITPVVDLPEDASDDDKRYQDFILSDFDNMEGGFGQYLETAVARTPFDGFAWFSAVPSLRLPGWVPPPFVDGNGVKWPDDWRSEADDGLIGIRRLAYRDSSTFFGWDMNGQKRVQGFIQQDFPYGQVTLPLKDSLHHQFGDPNNPEGNSPLQAVWRLERIKFGLEVIQGIGFEHSAGYLNVQKTETGTLSDTDKQNIADAARAILTAQEGNYAAWPYGITGEVKDISFSSAASLLEAIKHYSILMLSVYMMQFIALNTMTNTGAQASQVDSTNMGVFTFNSMLDGFAKQYDDQIGKRLYKWNKDSFPGMTCRPKIKFSHVRNNLDMGALGSFLNSISGIVPLGNDDMKALRKEAGWMPENNPEDDDIINGVKGPNLTTTPDAGAAGYAPEDMPEQKTEQTDAQATADMIRMAKNVYRGRK